MRPLKLIFEGLNSFEKRQTIDFKQLTDAHLFGIFGPTGAGKSTILDAITLALYGSVVRAPKNTGGILNTRCDSLYVEFEFMLGSGREASVYRVMRSYVRDKGDKTESRLQDSLKVKKCSLKRIDGDTETILCAEKANEINQNVSALLGLTMRDFVHSVVLPQGQFAEFLKMTGRERRDMLERLFHLEEFGRQLSDNLRERDNRLEMEYNANAAALGETGDVSEDGLKAALVQHKLDSDELMTVEKECAQARAEAEKINRLYELMQERREWQVRKMEHDARRDQISHFIAELDAAHRAEIVLPIGENVEKLSKMRVEQERDCVGAEHSLHSYAQLLERAEAEYVDKKSILGAERERAQSRMGSLETLQPRQSEIRRLEQEAAEIQRTIAESEKRTQDSAARLKKTEDSIANGEKFMRDVEKLAALDRNTDLEKLARGAELDRMRVEKQQRYEEAQKKLHDTETELARVEAELEQTRAQEIESRQAIAQAEENAARADAEFIQSTIRNEAAALAGKLEEGRPCPVCGSIHHPAPVTEKAEIIDTRAQAAAELKQRKDGHVSITINIARLAQSQESLDELRTERLREFTEQHEALSLVMAQWTGMCAELKVSDMQAAYAVALDNRTRAEEARRKLDAARQKLEAYRRSKSNYEMENLRNVQDMQRAGDMLKENQRKASSWAGELSRLGLPGDADIDTEIAQCRATINHANTSWEKQENGLKSCRAKKEEADRRYTHKKSELESTIRQLDEQCRLLETKLNECQFAALDDAQEVRRSTKRIEELSRAISEDNEERIRIESNLKRLEEAGETREINESERNEINEKVRRLSARNNELRMSLGSLDRQIKDMQTRLARRMELEKQAEKLTHARDNIAELKAVLRGGALVEYVANQYLNDITRMAGERLMFLTGNRYDLTLKDEGFIVRDMQRAGAERLTSTLSGGETFLVSLALALSLSLHINLKGQPLGFFFLDEGFGTLDDQLLSTVMDALTMLAGDNFAIGVISHVNAMKERISAQLVVSSGTDGSNAHVEFA